jgi:hypothetical protein
MAMSPVGLRPKTGGAGEAQQQPVITGPPSCQRGCTILKKTANVKINSKEVKEKFVMGSRWRPDTRTDWQTDCRSLDNFDFDFDLSITVNLHHIPASHKRR